MNQVIDIALPAEQREGTQATLQQWLVAEGDFVNADEPLAELETDKVTLEVCAPKAGILKEILVAPGSEINTNAVLGRISEMEPAAPGNQADPMLQPEQASEVAESARHLVGPAVRRLLRQHQLDIALIQGTGRDGRVTRDDVLAFIADPQSRHRSPDTAYKPMQNRSSCPNQIASQRIPHTSMRKTIAKHMVESLLHTAPHVTSVFEMDMSNIIEHRRWHKKEYLEQGIHLTYTAYFLAAAAVAIKSVPTVNARFHDDALEVFEDINIGVGTALEDRGLVVPVITHLQDKNLFELASALNQQTEKARAGTLTPADMQNGTFTLSNHGVGGSLFATPIIINQPQVAILGIGKLEKRVVVVERDGTDNIEIKPMCYVSLTIDHRALDAFQTNKFLSIFIEQIEHWGE